MRPQKLSQVSARIADKCYHAASGATPPYKLDAQKILKKVSVRSAHGLSRFSFWKGHQSIPPDSLALAVPVNGRKLFLKKAKDEIKF